MILSQSNGVLLLDDVPCKLLGANAYSLLARRVTGQTPDAYTTIIDTLADAGVKVVRIFGDMYDAAMGMGGWVTNQAAYLAHVTLILDYLQSKGMAAFWCIHWSVDKIPAYAGEAHSALTSGTTASRTYIKAVIDAVVPAFKDHPALAAWEVCNEPFNITVLTQAQIIALAAEMRGWVAAQDSTRIICGGWSNYNYPSVSGQTGASFDVQESYAKASDASFNCWSQHIYTDRTAAIGTNGDRFGSWLDRMALIARGHGKPLIVGEFGPNVADEATNQLQCQNLADGWGSATNAQLAFWWNCDVSDFSGNQSEVMFNSTTKPWILTHLRNAAGNTSYNPQPVILAAGCGRF